MNDAKANPSIPAQNILKVTKQQPSLIEFQFSKIERENGWKDLFETLDETTDDMFGDLSRDSGKDQDNRDLNRYKSILPYDHNRVKLSAKTNDYINASIVKCTLKAAGSNGSKSGSDGLQKSYVVTQGPLANTIPDFWLMVAQQRVRIIVMLCNVEEDGKSKCWQYFPSVTPGPSMKSSTPGNSVTTPAVDGFCGTGLKELAYLNFKEIGMRISFKTFSPLESVGKDGKKDFVIRELEMAGPSSNTSDNDATVYHCHYLTWPDFGVPDSTAFIKFWKEIRAIEAAHPECGEAPWVVHCSAGVGRSGTLVIIDACLRILEMDGGLEAINIQNLMIETRKYRKGMIQTADQLRFVYVVVLEAYKELTKPKTSIGIKSPTSPPLVPISPKPQGITTSTEPTKPSFKNRVTKEFKGKPSVDPNNNLASTKTKAAGETKKTSDGDASFLKKLDGIDELIQNYDKRAEWSLINAKLDETQNKEEPKVGASEQLLDGLKPENKGKNRESETIPENVDGVKLMSKTGNDYVNANTLFIKPLRRTYILAQSPMETTWEDFLMMAWDQECSVIVMLCQLRESDKDICFQYWPPDPPMEVDAIPPSPITSRADSSSVQGGSKNGAAQTGQESQMTPASQAKDLPFKEFRSKSYKIVNKGLRYKSLTYDVRSLEIVDIKNQTSQPMIQIQFKAWPPYQDDLGATLAWDHEDLLDFYLAYWETGIFASRKGNVIVHGNAVADRPSVFALLDSYLSLTQKSKDPTKFPKLSLLSQARTSRKGTLTDLKALRFIFIAYSKMCRSLAPSWFPQAQEIKSQSPETIVTCMSPGDLQSKYKSLTQDLLSQRAATGVLRSILMQSSKSQESPESEAEKQGKEEDEESTDKPKERRDDKIKDAKRDKRAIDDRNSNSYLSSSPTPSTSTQSGQSQTSKSNKASSLDLSSVSSQSTGPPTSRSLLTSTDASSSSSIDQNKNNARVNKRRYMRVPKKSQSIASTPTRGLVVESQSNGIQRPASNPTFKTTVATQTGRSLTTLDTSYLGYLDMKLDEVYGRINNFN